MWGSQTKSSPPGRSSSRSIKGGWVSPPGRPTATCCSGKERWSPPHEEAGGGGDSGLVVPTTAESSDGVILCMAVGRSSPAFLPRSSPHGGGAADGAPAPHQGGPSPLYGGSLRVERDHFAPPPNGPHPPCMRLLATALPARHTTSPAQHPLCQPDYGRMDDYQRPD